MGMYFHSDALAFQDRDLEIPAYFFDANVTDAAILGGATYTSESMESISLMIDVSITTQVQQVVFCLDENVDESANSVGPTKNAYMSSVEIENVPFVNPVRQALMLANELYECKSQRGKVDLEEGNTTCDLLPTCRTNLN